MAIDIGDAVLTFLGDTTNLDQTFDKVGTEVPAKMAPVEAAFKGTSDAVTEMTGQMAVGQSGAKQLGEVMNLAGETSRESMYEARGEAELLGEMMGIRLPRHVRSFVAELPGVGVALSAAFQATAVLFIIEAVAKGIEKIIEWREEAHKLELAQETFGAAVANSFGSLDEKLLSAQIKADELAGDHLGALKKELELIDHQSLAELEHQFQILASAADSLFKQLETSWYTFNLGSKGAEAALKDFKAQYDLLLATDQKDKASDLLQGTKKSAEEVLSLMQEFARLKDLPTDTWEETNRKSAEEVRILGELKARQVDINETKARSFGIDEKTFKAQEDLVAVLNAQANAQKEIADIASQNKANKTTEEAERAAADADRIFKAQAEAQKRADEQEDKEEDDRRNKFIASFEEQEKEKIAATRQGSQERIQIIDAAIKDEEAHGFQDTAYYKSLQVQRVQAVQARIAQEQKVQDDAAKKQLSDDEQAAKREVSLVENASKEQEKAIQDLGKSRVFSETETSRRLVAAYEDEKTKVLAVLNRLLQEEQALMEKAQTKLQQAKLNPAITPEQIAQAEALLAQLKNAVANTETQIEKVKSDANTKMLGMERGFYNQVLSLAIAAGNRKIAESLKENHAALLSAQLQLLDAKARGADTTAIEAQIKALQRHEAALLKDASNVLHVKVAGDQLLKTKPSWDSFFSDLVSGSLRAGEAIKEMGQMTAEGIGASVAAAVSGSSSFGAAMQKMAKDAIAALAEHAVVKALEELAYGFSDLANPFMSWHAPLHFMAAAKWGAIGGGAAALGAAIPGGGGSSGGGSASAGSGTPPPAPGSPAATAGGIPGSTLNVPRLSGGLVTQPTVAIVAGASSGGSAMKQIQAALAAHGSSVGDIHIKIETDLLSSARVISNNVKSGRVRMTSSNTLSPRGRRS